MITLIKSELFKQGGLEKYTWQIARDFCALNIPVTVLTSGSVTAPFDDHHLNIVSLPVHHSLSFLNVQNFDKACNAYLQKHPTPIIFSLDRNRFQTHLRAGNGVHAAYLERRSKHEGLLKKISFALNPLHRTILSLEKQAFEHNDLQLLFTNSYLVKEEVLRYYQTDPKKIVVVHNGVEWNAMRDSFEKWESAKEDTLRSFHLDPTAFQFLFVGHNYTRKGLEKLLRALSLIQSEHFQLSVVGKEKNLSYFLQLVKTLHLENKVFFWGTQPTIPFYQLADCMVIPSLYDPFANVTLEALAMGVPVISSKHNGGHEILSTENGSVIDSLNDAEGFATLLKSALGKPKTKELSQSVRESVRHLDFSGQLRLITETTLKSMAVSL